MLYGDDCSDYDHDAGSSAGCHIHGIQSGSLWSCHDSDPDDRSDYSAGWPGDLYAGEYFRRIIYPDFKGNSSVFAGVDCGTDCHCACSADIVVFARISGINKEESMIRGAGSTVPHSTNVKYRGNDSICPATDKRSWLVSTKDDANLYGLDVGMPYIATDLWKRHPETIADERLLDN